MFFLVTYGHFARARLQRWPPLLVAGAVSVVMGGLIEAAQGMSDTGSCELRDLLPDVAGVLIGVGIVLIWKSARSRGDLVPPLHDD